LLAAQGFRVVLLEHSHYESARFGEVLSPRVVPLLESLGVMQHFLAGGHLPSPGVVSAWGGLESERPSLMNPYGDGWCVDRVGFDHMLARAATDAGVTLYVGARLNRLARGTAGSGWVIDFSSENRAYTTRTRFLVDATGRPAKLARQLGAQQERVDRLVAVVALGETVTGADTRMLVESSESGWWYSAPLRSGQTVFAYLTDADLIPRSHNGCRWNALDAALRSAPCTFERARGITFSKTRVVSAASTHLLTPAGLGWLAVGDAANAFDPLSAHGVVRAISSGFYAAQVVAEYLSVTKQANDRALIEDYVRQCSLSWHRYLSERNQIYGSEKRWPDSVFWRRRRSEQAGDVMATSHNRLAFHPVLASSR
jgi:flavin-dependent dehydrogenase